MLFYITCQDFVSVHQQTKLRGWGCSFNALSGSVALENMGHLSPFKPFPFIKRKYSQDPLMHCISAIAGTWQFTNTNS